MPFLHVADSASHLGGPTPLGFIATAAVISVGAFLVFALPLLLQRRSGSQPDPDLPEPGVDTDVPEGKI